VFPSRTGTDPLNGNVANLTLDELDISAGVGGQVFVAGHAHGVGFPARKSGILDLDLVDDVGIRGEGESSAGAIGKNVGDANLDLIEVIQDIELGEVERSVVVNGVGVAGEDQIEPAATTTTTGCHAKFPADLLKLVAIFIQLLARERSGANTGGVGFQYTNDRLDAGRVEGKSLHGTSQAGGGGGNKGVCSVVEIKHEGVSTFNEGVGRVLVLLQERKLVDNVGLQLRAVFLLNSLESVRFICNPKPDQPHKDRSSSSSLPHIP